MSVNALQVYRIVDAFDAWRSATDSDRPVVDRRGRFMQRWSPRRWRKVAGAAVVAASLGAACVQQPAPNPDVSNPDAGTANAATLADFRKRADEYAALQKKLSETVGPLDGTMSPTQIAERERALGHAMMTSRAGATRGDIFTPAAGALFQTIIREEFAHRSRLALEDRDEAQDELPNFTPTVNQIYPTTYPLATFPPGVLTHLPALPDSLEYRFVQRALILRDVHANLIVDVLADAAPAMESLTPPRTDR
jgi:hypothetical protein